LLALASHWPSLEKARALTPSAWSLRVAAGCGWRGPEENGVVGAGAGQELAGGMEGDAVDRVGVAFQHGQLFSLGQLPEDDGLVVAGGGQQRIVGGKVDAVDGVGVALKGLEMFAGEDVPKADVSSLLAVASQFPCREKRTASTASVCPLRTWTTLPVSTSQMRAVSSSLAVASSLPSGRKPGR